MKDSEPKSSEDLDAGWDTSDDVDTSWNTGDRKVSSVSVKPVKSVAPAATGDDLDLDMGWDASSPETLVSRQSPQVTPAAKIQLTLSRLPSTAACNEKSARKAAEAHRQQEFGKQPVPVAKAALGAPVAPPAVAPAQPSHKLTKKERRDLERQQRAQSAKKQAEFKRKRKEQRRAVSLNEPTALPALVEKPAPSAPSQSASKAKSRRRSKARRAVRPVTASQAQEAQLAPRVSGRGTAQAKPNAIDRISSPGDATDTSHSATSRRHMIWWTLGIVVVVLALLFYLQKK